MANLRDLKKLDPDDVLELIGLERRRGTSDWLLPTLGAFSVGVLVGVSVGLMLAPKSGPELRGDLRNRPQGSPLGPQPSPGTAAAQPQPPQARTA
jgi:hypothetical protein